MIGMIRVGNKSLKSRSSNSSPAPHNEPLFTIKVTHMKLLRRRHRRCHLWPHTEALHKVTKNWSKPRNLTTTSVMKLRLFNTQSAPCTKEKLPHLFLTMRNLSTPPGCGVNCSMEITFHVLMMLPILTTLTLPHPSSP